MSVDLQADSLGSFECHAAEGAPALYGASSIDGEKSGAKEAAGSGSGPCKRNPVDGFGVCPDSPEYGSLK